MSPRGGRRQGAGRPKGKGKFGEETQAVRLPVSLVPQLLTYAECEGFCLPLYSSSVSAGFPSPADDHMQSKLDLNQHLIQHPTATFFVKASGESMLKAGIHDGDLLIVDRSLEATHGRIVIAAVDGQLTVKRLWKQKQDVRLLAENDHYPPIHLEQDSEVYIWGVVTNVIHSL